MEGQQDQAAMFRDLMRVVHNLGRNQALAPPQNGPINANNTGSIVEQFPRFKPPSFDGKTNHLATE